MSSRPLRILVVDDDPAMVGAITALVGTEGHQVITAYDGLTAVKRFREEHPDLVLLDLAMPGPGRVLASPGQMRAVGQAPILVVSGESGEAAKVRALGIGADDYLTKPFGKAELLARIAAIMRRVDRSGAGSGGAGRARSRPAALVLEPGRHEARVGDDAAVAHADRVPPARGARPGATATSSRTCSWPVPAGRPRPIPDLLWLKPHLARLRAKVEDAGGPHVVAVRGVGYRIVVDDEAAGGSSPALDRRPGDRGAGSRRRWRPARPVASCAASAQRDPAAAGIAPAERVEVEPGLAARRQATATRRAGDRARADRRGPPRDAEVGVGRVEHRGHHPFGRVCGGQGVRHGPGAPGVTLPHHDRSLGLGRPPVAIARDAAGLRVSCGRWSATPVG